MKISKLEYLKMQVELAAAFCSRDGVCTSETHADKGDFCKTMIDRILENNGITVANEAEAKPISVTLHELQGLRFADGSLNYELVTELLLKRGVIA